MRVLVHDDGCGETLINGFCPRCRFHPDMQSTAFKDVPNVEADSRRVTSTISQSELNRLVEQIHSLREALRPFAVFGDALPAVIEEQPRITDAGAAFSCKSPRDPMGPERVITFADLRRAHALLSSLEAADEKRFIERVERKMAGVSDTCTALNCNQPIPGSEPHHLRGFCSERCELAALAWSKKSGGL